MIAGVATAPLRPCSGQALPAVERASRPLDSAGADARRTAAGTAALLNPFLPSALASPVAADTRAADAPDFPSTVCPCRAELCTAEYRTARPPALLLQRARGRQFRLARRVQLHSRSRRFPRGRSAPPSPR